MSSKRPSRPRNPQKSAAVLTSLQDMCGLLPAGAVIPSHKELMHRFEASERTVLWALNELRRQGKIVRRAGAKTVVANPEAGLTGESRAAAPPTPTFKGQGGPVSGMPGPASTAVGQRTVVAILEPDGAIFDMALRTLVQLGKQDNIRVRGCLLQPAEAGEFDVAFEEPPSLGYILFRKDFAALAYRLQTRGNRVVLVGGQDAEGKLPVPNIYMGHVEGGKLLTQYLIGLGHRRLLFQSRWAGVSLAIDEAFRRGIKVETAFLEDETVATWAREPAVAAAFFSEPDAPTAIVAWNDQRAVSLLTLLQRAGIRVPEDVSLAGYDNLPLAATLHPALTTVDSAVAFQVSLALHMLLHPETVALGQMVVVNPTLIVRDSCGPPKKPTL